MLLSGFERELNMGDRTTTLAFYGLRRQPFGVTPDPQFLYLSASHREALASLLYAIQTRRGFSALVAEPGMGKTTLLFQLLKDAEKWARTAFLFHPDCNSHEFLKSLLDDLGITPGEQDMAGVHRLLNEVLLKELQAGRRFVLAIDEAQNLDVEVLESIRLLSNFETPSSKLMHIILAGQPLLEAKLERPELSQLKQRISTVSHLEPFSQDQTIAYINHRMMLAGMQSSVPFTPSAFDLIFECSQGIPRKINNLCFLSLSLGFVKREANISMETVQEAARDAGLTLPQPQESHFLPSLPALDIPQPGYEDWGAMTRPRRSSGIGLVVLAFFLIPLCLIVLLSDQRIDWRDSPLGQKLNEIMTVVSGSEPAADLSLLSKPAVLRPPAAPPLAKIQPAAETTADAPSDPNVAEPSESPAGTEIAQVRKSAGALLAQARVQRFRESPEIIHGPLDVRVWKEQTLFQLALKYYGRSNGYIVEKIIEANPDMRSLYTVVHPGQHVILPDLSPQYSIQSASQSGDTSYLERQTSRYRQ
jgi:general secretion pathway protein A